MKVICINNDGRENQLTIGKIYDGREVNHSKSLYSMSDNREVMVCVARRRFIPVTVDRDIKLKQILK